MKNIRNKKMLLVLVSIALLLTVAVSSTLAYLTDRTESVTNTFTPTSADITITDEVNNGVKENVVITNGGVKAFIRAKVVANWMLNGNIVAPWKDDIKYNTSEWSNNDDGFYYFHEAVEANKKVEPTLFDSYEPQRPEGVPEDAELVMDIIVQAVQAEGIGEDNAVDAFAKLAQAK